MDVCCVCCFTYTLLLHVHPASLSVVSPIEACTLAITLWMAITSYMFHACLMQCDAVFFSFLLGWVHFMPLGWLASMCSVSSAPCTINAGLSWPPTCPTRECSRPPSLTTSTWVCCSSSSSSVCYLLCIPSWPCHLHLTADPSGASTHNRSQTWLMILLWLQPSCLFPHSHTYCCFQWEGKDVWCNHGDNWLGPASLHGDTLQLCCQPRPHHTSCATHGVSV